MTATRVGIGLTATALAGGVAAAIKRDSTRAIDHAIRRRIHPRRSPRVTAVAKGVSFLAGPHIHPAVAALLGFMLRIERGRAGYGPSAASVGAWGIDNAARIFVHQKRPPKAGPHHSRYRYAYPSGHTTAATAIGVATASAIADDLPRSQQILLWTTVAAFALGVGWSRLYLDEHWLDDVVGGWLAGTVIGLGAASLDARLS
ncbi:MAG TPA: phosphatase PAP2 family protein [Gemmatimonadaceae bacterium]|nr:phosphatase PAP2 family protein [Gemmatimonadaceae bacterium]